MAAFSPCVNRKDFRLRKITVDCSNGTTKYTITEPVSTVSSTSDCCISCFDNLEYSNSNYTEKKSASDLKRLREIAKKILKSKTLSDLKTGWNKNVNEIKIIDCKPKQKKFKDFAINSKRGN
jgi:hypothetical protein